MHECTITALSCWIEAHAYVVWIAGIASVIALVLAGISTGRAIKRTWQEMREIEQWHEEERNEWKALQQRIQATIRQGEEWEVDVQPLKETNRRLILTRKTIRLIEGEKARMILPAPFLMIFLFIIGIVPTIWTLTICCVAFVVAIIWWIYHGWMWSRYRWFLQMLEREEAKTDTRGG